MGNKCVICGKDSGKGRTCGSTCRSKLARTVAKENATLDDATLDDATLDATVSGTMTPEGSKPEVPANYGQADCGDKLSRGLCETVGSLKPYKARRWLLPSDLDSGPKPEPKAPHASFWDWRIDRVV